VTGECRLMQYGHVEEEDLEWTVAAAVLVELECCCELCDMPE